MELNDTAVIRGRRSWSWWRWVLTGLSALALGLSAYLGWHYLVGGSMIGCGGPGAPGCDQVLSSRWSTVGGALPVSGLATGVYLAMLVASFFLGPATEAPVRRLAWGALLVLVGVVFGSATWFTIVQICIVGAFCSYCMASHIIGLILAALVIWRARVQFDDNSTDVVLKNPAPAIDSWSVAPDSTADSMVAAPVQDVSQGTRLRIFGRLPAIGLSLAGILAACQVSFTPPVIHHGGQSQDNLPSIDPHAVPLIGSPDATYVVTLLFDYKCPHCQQLHFMLDEAIRRYDGKLAFALCPAPLNTQCNPYIPRDVDQFKDSCELAKVGLAVWVAERESYSAFDRWMFSLESGDVWRPRSLDAARAKAVEFVGQAKFDAARADPWIDPYQQTCVRIYGDTIHLDRGGNALPKLVFGSRWVTPRLNNVDDLIRILHDSLAVPRTDPTEAKKEFAED